MRIEIPKFDKKQELFKYLTANKSRLISEKKSMPIVADCMKVSPVFCSAANKGVPVSVKANEPVTDPDIDTLRVKVVANTANWLDNHFDMLTSTSWDKTIRERAGYIPHLHDHRHEIGAKIGEVENIESINMSYKDLGIPGNGSTHALVFTTEVIKEYNEKVFNQYKAGRVNQHSIGLQYVKLDLAINDQDYDTEYKVWLDHYEDLINKEKADESGFFWVVKEIKLIENSAVLFGSNEITPTLDNNLDKSQPPPSTDTDEPSVKDTRKTVKILNSIT